MHLTSKVSFVETEVRDQLDAVLATTRRLKFGSDG
jgi:hypothetical protein